MRAKDEKLGHPVRRRAGHTVVDGMIFMQCFAKNGVRENSRPLQETKFDFGQRFPISNDDTVSSDIRQFGLMPACISYLGELVACRGIRVINLNRQETPCLISSLGFRC